MKPKNPTPAQRKKFLEDLEMIFQAALEGKNFPAAVKAKELQAKELGFFSTEDLKKLSLKDLNNAALQRLLKEIEARPLKHVQDLEGVKKEICELKEALEARENLKTQANQQESDSKI